MKGIFVSLVVLNILVAVWFEFGFQGGETKEMVDDFTGVKFDNLVLSGAGGGSGVGGSMKDLLSCMEIGVFDDRNSADQIVARLGSVDIGSKVVSYSTQVIKDYWVYIPPLSGYSEAKSKVAELNLKGVDSFIFSEGELKNGLSLGVYSNRDNATGIFQKVSALGYSPKIKETMAESRSYAVLVSEEGLAYFNESIFESLKLRYVDIKRKKVVCQ